MNNNLDGRRSEVNQESVVPEIMDKQAIWEVLAGFAPDKNFIVYVKSDDKIQQYILINLYNGDVEGECKLQLELLNDSELKLDARDSDVLTIKEVSKEELELTRLELLLNKLRSMSVSLSSLIDLAQTRK